MLPIGAAGTAGPGNGGCGRHSRLACGCDERCTILRCPTTSTRPAMTMIPVLALVCSLIPQSPIAAPGARP